MDHIRRNRHGCLGAGSSAKGLRGRRAVVSVATTVGLVAVPGTIGSSAPSSSRIAPAPSGAALCHGVSANAVSRVVGYRCRGPTAVTTADTFDKTLGIHETSTDCVYGKATSAASGQRYVTLDYETLSKAPPHAAAVADIRAAFAEAVKRLPPGGKAIYKVSTALGVTTLFAEVTTKVLGESFTFEVDFGWMGTKVAGALVLYNMSESKLKALEILALNNWGI